MRKLSCEVIPMDWLVWLLIIAAVAVPLTLGHMAATFLKALDEADREIEE